MNKFNKTNQDVNLKEMVFERTDFQNPKEVAINFATWINLYFEVYAANHDTWIDSRNYAYTSEELFEEFNKQYNTN